ncbi:MAG: DUF2235 domain-containing protein [Pseudomonadota bacterium]|nr:DUF2235 domain-containing protein [Pseudomonadota bacterium]
MGQEDNLDDDGIRHDDVPYYQADTGRLHSYSDAAEALSEFQAPVLLDKKNPHARLYFASFDGTGSDFYKDPQHATNVAEIYTEISEGNNPAIAAGYVPGPGTQDHFLSRTLDGMNGNTYDERIEAMYKKFIEKALEWKKEDPDAKISLADIGFSRGSEQAAGFARMVHERGIQDPSGAHYTYDRHYQIVHVEYSRPPLVEPGKVAQVVGLFDAVGTGEPVRQHDRRLPPSVISGFQIIAADERRGLFKSDHIIDPGATPDGRFLGVTVAGAHSDIGGYYFRNGLAIRSDNLMKSYLNGLSDQPFLKLQAVPDDPRLNVVHRSEDGMLIYRLGTKIDRLSPDGYNELLVPRREVEHVFDPKNAEQRDGLLSRQFEHHNVPVDAHAVIPDMARDTAANDLSARLDRMLTAGQSDDWITFSRENQALAYGEAGRSMLTEAAIQVERLELVTAQQAAQQLQAPPLQQSTQGPAM